MGSKSVEGNSPKTDVDNSSSSVVVTAENIRKFGGPPLQCKRCNFQTFIRIMLRTHRKVRHCGKKLSIKKSFIKPVRGRTKRSELLNKSSENRGHNYAPALKSLFYVQGWSLVPLSQSDSSNSLEIKSTFVQPPKESVSDNTSERSLDNGPSTRARQSRSQIWPDFSYHAPTTTTSVAQAFKMDESPEYATLASIWPSYPPVRKHIVDGGPQGTHDIGEVSTEANVGLPRSILEKDLKFNPNNDFRNYSVKLEVGTDIFTTSNEDSSDSVSSFLCEDLLTSESISHINLEPVIITKDYAVRAFSKQLPGKRKRSTVVASGTGGMLRNSDSESSGTGSASASEVPVVLLKRLQDRFSQQAHFDPCKENTDVTNVPRVEESKDLPVEAHKCDQCRFEATTKVNLALHRRIHHPSKSGRKRQQCARVNFSKSQSETIKTDGIQGRTRRKLPDIAGPSKHLAFIKIEKVEPEMESSFVPTDYFPLNSRIKQDQLEPNNSCIVEDLGNNKAHLDIHRITSIELDRQGQHSDHLDLKYLRKPDEKTTVSDSIKVVNPDYKYLPEDTGAETVQHSERSVGLNKRTRKFFGSAVVALKHIDVSKQQSAGESQETSQSQKRNVSSSTLLKGRKKPGLPPGKYKAADQTQQIQDEKVYSENEDEVTQFVCHYCSKCFLQKESLIRHFSAHVGQFPFTCISCPKAFSQLRGLIRHLESHSGIWYHCGRCEFLNQRLSALKEHHLRVHGKDEQLLVRSYTDQ